MIEREEALTRLAEIYAKIPKSACVHCHTCCGPILWFEPEEIQIREYLEQHHLPYIQWTQEEFETHQMQCPYVHKDRCNIYAVRPMVCRLQGVTNGLQCSQVRSDLLTEKQVYKIKDQLVSLLRDMDALEKFYGTRRLADEVK
jgi:Fe-S-cluster containining protein